MNFILLLASQASAQDIPSAPTADQTAVWMEKGIEIGGNVLVALITLIIGWMVAGWLQKLVVTQMTKRELDVSVSRFLGNIVRYMFIAATLIAALARVGIETTSVLAILGSAGLAVGLALQGSLGNFASGVMILFFRPFSVGQVVSAAGHTGMVEDIGLFATTMITPDNDTIIIPNAAITAGSIVNFANKGTRRAAIDVGVAYGTDLKQVEALLIQAASESSLVHKDPGPALVFVNMGASSIDFKLFVWVDWADWVGVQGDVRSRCYDALNTAGIDIPYQTITLIKDEG